MPEHDDNYYLNQPAFNKARKDKFLLVFTLPAILRDLNVPIFADRESETIKQDTMQFSIWGSPVPDISIPAISMNYDGQPYKVTSQDRQAYPPIMINFTVDNRFMNWWIIWKWLDVLNIHRDSGMPNYFGRWQDIPKQTIDERVLEARNNGKKLNKPLPSEHINPDLKRMQNDFLAYQTIMTVYALDEYNEKIVKFDYHNAFPTQLAGIQYNYRDEKEIESSFHFEFSQMSVELIGPKR